MNKEQEKIKIPEIIRVGDFAERLGVPVSEVVAELMKNGVMATINENIDFETAEIIADFLGYKVEKEESQDTKKKVKKSSNLKPRPPIVAVLGHVDHGKTSLLDKIRETDVAAKESGGITQHIGAYQIETKEGKITFLDTPGHEAFEKMRQHGAQVTDIAILIVAADDGVKPQTEEAIKHIKDAGTKMIVAVNKIDKPDADPMLVRKQLMERGISPQEWGGDYEFVDVSAKTGEGIDKLLETIIALAEVMELKADPDGDVQGVVIESNLEPGKGPVATILIQNGTLKAGDYIQAGVTYGRVKSMEDENQQRVEKALPSEAVKVSGLKAVPNVSDLVQSFATEKEAKEEAERSKKYSIVKRLQKENVKKIDSEALTKDIKESKKEDLGLVIKADVVGSLEAIKESLKKLSNNYVNVRFVGEGVGEVSENDIKMSEVSNKIIIAFKVKVPTPIEQLAKSKGVKIMKYEVIYELISDIKKIISDMMPVERIENTIGNLKVLAVFKVSPKKTVVGGRVEDGKIEKGSWARHKRDKEILGEYEMSALQKNQDEVASVTKGEECGVSFAEKVKIKEGDILEFYTISERKKEA